MMLFSLERCPDCAGNYQSLASRFRAKDRHPMLRIDPFNLILANNLMQNVINFTVWFALVFWAFLETRSVFVTGMIGGIYLVFTAGFAIWFGSLEIGSASSRERVCQYV